MRRLRAAALLLALFAVVPACGDDGEQADAGPAQTDTTNQDPLDGLSSEQIQEQARPMTPEEAAAAGIAVDTSVHLENLGEPDSALIPGAVPPPGGRMARPDSPQASPPAAPDTTKRQ